MLGHYVTLYDITHDVPVNYLMATRERKRSSACVLRLPPRPDAMFCHDTAG